MAKSKATPKGKTGAGAGAGAGAKSKSNNTSAGKTTKKTTAAKAAGPAAKSKSNTTSASRAKRKSTLEPVLPSHDRIAVRAYEIWESSGYPAGCEKEHWIQAEQDLLRSEMP